MSMPNDVCEVLTFFSTAEHTFLETLNNEEHREEFEAQYRAASKMAASLAQSGRFDEKSSSLIASAVSRIKLVAQTFCGLEENLSCLQNHIECQAKNYVLATPSIKRVKATPDAVTRSPKGKNCQPVSEGLNGKVLRQWMLENIAHPYPTLQEKKELAHQVNLQNGRNLLASSDESTKATMTPDQCALWFTNGRRRSRWQEFNRIYGLNFRSRMEQIVDVIQKHNEAPEKADDHTTPCLALEDVLARDKKGVFLDISEGDLARHSIECRELFAHIIGWVSQSTKDRVGPWLEDVIKEVTAEEKQRKKERRAKKRQFRQEREAAEEAKQIAELDCDTRHQSRTSRCFAPYPNAARRSNRASRASLPTPPIFNQQELVGVVGDLEASPSYSNARISTPVPRTMSVSSCVTSDNESDWGDASCDSMPSLISDRCSFVSSCDSSIQSPNMSHSAFRPLQQNLSSQTVQAPQGRHDNGEIPAGGSPPSFILSAESQYEILSETDQSTSSTPSWSG